ncbi:MAG: hypothetical protein RIQ89_2240 [Bacteroidota bacterium]
MSGLLLVLAILAFALYLPSVQTYLAKIAAKYLTKELGATVTIDKVNIRFFNQVTLKNLLLADQQDDTLLFVGSLEVDIAELSTAKKIIALKKVKLTDAQFLLHHPKDSLHDNLYFLTEYLSSDDTTHTPPWSPTVEELELSNFRFKYDDDNDDALAYGVDFSHLDVSKVSGSFSDIIILNDTIFADISKLAFQDKSGFKIDRFEAKAKVSTKEINCNQLFIQSPHTNLVGNLIFEYNSWGDFDDFISKVKFYTYLQPSIISFADIAYFAPELKGLDEKINLAGEYKGTVNKLRGKKVALAYGNNTFYRGNVSLTGLPYIDDTYIDLQVQEAQVTAADISNINAPPFENRNKIPLPKMLTKLGKVNFKGNFTGFVNDFVAYGNFNSDLGYFSSDVNLKLDPNQQHTAYSGHIFTKDFHLGYLLDHPKLGKVNASLDIVGTDFSFNNMKMQLTGNVAGIEYMGYNYHNIDLNATLAKKILDGSVIIKEENVDLAFNGIIDFASRLPNYKFTLDAQQINFKPLHIFNTPNDQKLSALVNINLEGDDLDNIEGTILVNDFNLLANKKMYHLNHLSFVADKFGIKREMTLNSDFVDAHFDGIFEFKTLIPAFTKIVPQYIPAIEPSKITKTGNQDFIFDLVIKNTSFITEMFLPSWYFESDTKISGSFKSLLNAFSINAHSGSIKYKTFDFDNASLKIDASQQMARIDYESEKVYYADSMYIEFPKLNAEISNNTIRYFLQLANIDTLPNSAMLKGNVNFIGDEIGITVLESKIKIQHDEWKLDSSNFILVDKVGVNFKNFNFNHNEEQLKLYGVIGDSAHHTLALNLQNFKLFHINPLLKNINTECGGIANGLVNIKAITGSSNLQGNLAVTQLVLNKDTLGDAEFSSQYDVITNTLNSAGSIKRGSLKVLEFEGKYLTKELANNIDYKIKIAKLDIAPFGKYLSEVVSNVKGRVNAELKLKGTFSQPKLTGKLHFLKTNLLVNYLNTYYNFTSDVEVNNNSFEFKDFAIEDLYNNSAIINGFIYHQAFENFNFDIDLKAKNFHALNTNGTQNSLYYGSAFVDGTASFEGPLDEMKIAMLLTSKKNTIMNLPITSSSQVEESNFITFINTEAQKVVPTNASVLKGISLDLNIIATPDAEMKIIFDEKIGDVITGRGSGNINMRLTDDGEFTINGSYNIAEGEYLFTLKNLINKKYYIEPPSSISWSGDPYNANIDIRAVYKTSTSTLYTLIEDSTYRRRLPVDCRLFLSDKLMNPTINYSIEVKGLDAAAQSAVASRLNSEGELNRQIFGLLVLNRFLPSGDASAARVDAGSGVGANASELLSNQVSNWLNQINTGLNLGFNYKPKDDFSDQEYGVQFSKSLLNDRFTLEGNVGYVNRQNSNTVVGEFNAEYKLGDGRFKLRGYNRSNNNSIFYVAPYTQGIGIFYREEFNNINQLFKREKKIVPPTDTSSHK